MTQDKLVLRWLPTLFSCRQFHVQGRGPNCYNSVINRSITSTLDGVKGMPGTLTVPAQINGQDTHFERSFEVRSPTSQKLLHHSTAASVKDALAAVDAAYAALGAWRNASATERRDIFLRTAEIVQRRSAELEQIMCDETGAPRGFAGGFNIPYSVSLLKDIAGRISGITGTVPSVDQAGSSAIVYKEPYGVVLGIAPW